MAQWDAAFSLTPAKPSETTQDYYHSLQEQDTTGMVAFAITFFAVTVSQTSAMGSRSSHPATAFLPPPKPDFIDVVRSLERLHPTPPSSYDWVAALRYRLRNGGANPEALMTARKEARVEEKGLFMANNPEEDYIFDFVLRCRDVYDWNVGE
ncbi:hypothetical protein RQP46_006299 [Phenoliferia psychrophenolica]